MVLSITSRVSESPDRQRYLAVKDKPMNRVFMPVVAEQEGVDIFIKGHAVADDGALQTLSKQDTHRMLLVRNDATRRGLHVAQVQHKLLHTAVAKTARRVHISH